MDAGSRLRPPGVTGSGAGRLGSSVADSSAGLDRLGESGAGAGRPVSGDPGERRPPPTGRRRAGATRADPARPDTAGATALQPRLPDPDEVTDTGARRTRNTFHVADDPDAYAEEPSLLLMWGIFLAQTLIGGAVGLGIWLGFYRLWSTWPFYAAPAVGVALTGMLVVARMLRRRYGHDLDLLTAIVTVGVGTVLTVLPAAFTLQSLA
ncbi:MAG: hypothetical protein ACJ73E_01015 [Mycobacteriales bacterium]